VLNRMRTNRPHVSLYGIHLIDAPPPIWIVAAMLLLALIGFIYSQERMMGCDAFESGGTLYLMRSNVSTISRAFLLRS
jgi:hypothetical protein